MWNDLFTIDRTDRIAKMTFRLFDVIKGSGSNRMPKPKISATMKLTTITVRLAVSL